MMEGSGDSTNMKKRNFTDKFWANTKPWAWMRNTKVGTFKVPILREQWKRKFDFLLACAGFSIGLGNLWRFPYLCYKNGGGAFLIPYLISVFIAGIPLFLLEVSLGQFMARGAILAWDVCPLFRGLGCTSTMINFLVNCYYTVIIGWGLHYLFSSFTDVLPWTKCDGWWNTANCGHSHSTFTNESMPKQTAAQPTNTSSFLRSDPVTEYWERRVLGLSSGIEELGTVQWELALCLLLAWLIIFLCICKGIKTSRKIMYFTVTSPYVFMLILLIRTSLLDGASIGLAYFIQPDWNKITDMTVWSDAGTQIFFSYCIGLGALTAFGSYNKFHHNSFRDCLLFAALNTVTSLLAGCVIFATLGNMSKLSNVSIDLVAESGPGLAFVIYPKALGSMPGSPFWSVCFFLMLFLLGIDSMFGGVEGFVTSLADFIPRIHSSKKHRYLAVGIVCLLSYAIGLTMVTNAGMYVFQLFDHYSGSRIILVVGFLETIVVGYVYGGRRFSHNLRCMYGFSLGWLPVLFWCFLTPTFTMLLFVYSVIKYEQLAYRRAGQTTPYEFPIWSVNLGWLMASSTLFLIPIAMIVQILQTSGPFFQRLRTLLTPKLPDHSIEEMNSLRSSGAMDRTASNPICEIIRLSMEDDYEGASNRRSLPNGT